MTEHQVVGVIPARYGSTRFPGKPLAEILGMSLIQRVYENASRASSLDALIVATDDERIFDHVRAFGGEVVMTSPAHPTGSDRLAEVARSHLGGAEIVVNIQGDEPCLDPNTIEVLVDQLRGSDAVITTAVTPITDSREFFDTGVVKCVFDVLGRALYFSRSPVPFSRESGAKILGYRHLGVYCFRREFLLAYGQLESTPLQKREDLEQLKVLEQGYPIYVSVVKEEGIGVDTPEDLKKVERLLCKESTSSSQEALSPL